MKVLKNNVSWCANVVGKLKLSLFNILGVLLKLKCDSKDIWKILGLKVMNDQINFRGKDSSDYSLKITDETITLDCYLIGSISGGKGTECAHTIGNQNIPAFLESLSCSSLEELTSTLRKYGLDEWNALHTIIQNFQTDSFVWTETNWD